MAHKAEAGEQTKTYEEHVREGWLLQASGDIEGAIAAYVNAINERGDQPAHFGLFLNLANCFRHQALTTDEPRMREDFFSMAGVQYARSLRAAKDDDKSCGQILVERSKLFYESGEVIQASQDILAALRLASGLKGKESAKLFNEVFKIIDPDHLETIPVQDTEVSEEFILPDFLPDAIPNYL